MTTKGTIKGNKITIGGKVATIHIKKFGYDIYRILIDTEDVDKVRDHTWRLQVITGNMYVVTTINGKITRITQLILGLKNIKVVYINNRGLDNRKSNLILSTNTGLKGNDITIDGNVAIIHIESPKYGHFEAQVDLEDLHKVIHYTWHVHGISKGDMYIATEYKGKFIQIHRLLMDYPVLGVDHINGNTLDNRKSNLRVCTKKQNSFNRKSLPNSSSQYKGVRWIEKSNKWGASIQVEGKSVHLGYFIDEMEAAKTYDRAARKYHGEYARLNFPD